MDPEVAITAAHNRIRRDRSHFLRDYADVDPVAAVVGKTVEPEAIVETTEKVDVMLQPDVGPPSTTASAPTPAASKAASATARTAKVASATARRSVAEASATRLSLSRPARLDVARSALLRRTPRLSGLPLAGLLAASTLLRRTPRLSGLPLADLLAASTIARWPIGGPVLCMFPTVTGAGLEHLLTVAAAKIRLALRQDDLCCRQTSVARSDYCTLLLGGAENRAANAPHGRHG